VCLHLYIPGKFGERGSTPRGATGPSLSFCFFCLSFCLFVCPSRYDARHRKPTRCVYALNLGGTGISPPDKSTPDKNLPGPGHPTSGDIFYCSGSRQLNHSSHYQPTLCISTSTEYTRWRHGRISAAILAPVLIELMYYFSSLSGQRSRFMIPQNF